MAWIPNTITVLRLLLGIAFPWCDPAWRLPVIVVAAITDGLDGQASRWLHAESPLGRVLDPIADKVFFGAVAATLVCAGTMTALELVLIGMRDLIVGLGAGVALASHGSRAWKNMPPRIMGKLATVGQFAFLAVVLLHWGWARHWLLGIAATVSTAAGVDYVLTYVRRSRIGS